MDIDREVLLILHRMVFISTYPMFSKLRSPPFLKMILLAIVVKVIFVI